jgi:tRNA pseudouridine38-40 synthase
LSSFDLTQTATQRWRLDLAYDGRGLHGFAEQPDHPTVVGLLREVLARLTRSEVGPLLYGAGRTDAGVHAFAQVVHVDLPDPLFRDDRGEEGARLQRSLNAQLAGRVRVLRLQRVAPEFHARFSATWRAYRYLVLPAEPPALELTDALAWSVVGPLDVERMNEAAATLLGEHDFRAFCRKVAGTSPDDPLRREILSATWTVVPDQAGIHPDGHALLRFDVRATSFCHQMVRRLTSALVAVGQGKLPVSALADRFVDFDRTVLPGPAPAAGLALVGVGYDQFAGGPSGFVT